MGYHVTTQKRNKASLDPYKIERAKDLYMNAEVINLKSIAQKTGLKVSSVEWLRDSNGWAVERDAMIIETRYGKDYRKAYLSAKQTHQFSRTVLASSIKTARQTQAAAKRNGKVLSQVKLRELARDIADAKTACKTAQQEIDMIKRVIARKTSGNKIGMKWTQTDPADIPPANITEKLLGDRE